jgi:membrane associated rhomboid family serine protease
MERTEHSSIMTNILENLRALIPVKIRALPPLSLGVAVLWTTAFLVLQLGYADLLRDVRQVHRSAADLASRNSTIEVGSEQMQVVRAVDPDFEMDPLFEFMRRQQSEAAALLQASFDELAGRAQTILAEHPFRSVGHVPSATTPGSYVSYFLLHANFAHFITTLFVFLLVAPVLESTWGPKRLGLAMLVLVPLGAAVHSLAFADSPRALIGGSSLVAGLVAATLVRFWGEDVELLDWLSPFAPIQVRVPAMALGVLWLGYEALLWQTAQGALPPGIDNDPGYASHAATAFLGFVGAICFAALGLEERTPARSPTRKTTARHFDLARVRAMRERGETEGAFALLASEVRHNASNRDVVMTYWEMAVDRETPMEAAPVMIRLLDEELRRGAQKDAIRIWHQLDEHAPDCLLHPEILFRLVPLIRAAEGTQGALEALRQIVDRRNAGFTAADGAKVARWTAEIDPKLAAAAAQRAIDSLDLDEKEQAEIEMLARALGPEERKIRTDESPSNTFLGEYDRSAFGESKDLSDLTNSFPDGAVTDAIPQAIQTDALTIEVEGREPSVLAWSRIRAVSIVGVRGLAETPTLLFDLLIDGRGTERPLSVIRFRCDRFDPCSLVPEAKTRREALQALLQKLLSGGTALCLVDATTAKPGPETLFDSLDAYHEQVLRAASGVLG